MNEVVERILRTYELMGRIDADRIEASREKISGYIEKLNGAGFNNYQLTMYGLAYLKELHEGLDARFSGC
jgi:hypothetical protein